MKKYASLLYLNGCLLIIFVTALIVNGIYYEISLSMVETELYIVLDDEVIESEAYYYYQLSLTEARFFTASGEESTLDEDLIDHLDSIAISLEDRSYYTDTYGSDLRRYYIEKDSDDAYMVSFTSIDSISANNHLNRLRIGILFVIITALSNMVLWIIKKSA